METAPPPMSIGDPPTSSERSARPRVRSITVGRATADAGVHEDTPDSRTLDSRWLLRHGPTSEGHRNGISGHRGFRGQGGRRRQPLDFTSEAVSYTHLTLPTICSV
eukprot:11477204-Alexandrium_andersonii.AAC.1